MKSLIELLPYIVGGYEALVRLWPSKKNRSILHAALAALTALSGFLNKEKPYKSSGRTLTVIFIVCSCVLMSCAAVRRVNCISSKTVLVTVKTGDSTFYTVRVPYCDTIEYKKKADIDTLKIN